MLNVIKEYLVSLGFETEMSSFNQAQNSIKTVDKAITTFAGNSVKQFATAGTALSTFLVAANVGIAKFITGLAKADLENEKFARRMWMSKENAVAYKNTLSALGAELQDLYLSPELLQRYNQLRGQAAQMSAPQEYNDQMKQIREITFEFQRMKLEATYAMQWIGYYLFKYLEKPINNIRQALKKLNDNITKEMPTWTKKVAQVLSWFVRLGSAAVWGLGKIKDSFDSLTPATKTAGVAITGLFTLFKMGPIGWLIAGLTALLLLMDDYKTWKSGGQSYFGDEWAKLDEFKKGLDDDGVFDSFNDSLDSISKSLGNIFQSIGKIADKVAEGLGFKDFKDMLGAGVQNALNLLADTLESIAGAVQIIDGILSGDTDKMQTGLEKLITGSNKVLFGRETGEDINEALKKGSSGDIPGMTHNFARAVFGPIIGEDLVDDMAKNSSETFVPLWNSIKKMFSKHADGGIQTTPHLGWVAEEYPESIIPLDPNKRQNALNLLSQTAGILGAPMTNSTSSTINYYNVTNSPKYTIHGNEPTATAKAIDRTVDYGQLIRNFREVY